MMDDYSDWINISYDQTLGIVITTTLIFFALLIFIKLNGLRSFAKLSSHDFAVTIAIGSILGAVAIQKTPSLMQGIVAIATFLFLQAIYSAWRMFRPDPYIENSPLLLMRDGEMIKDNMKEAKISESDLTAKLRESNVLQLENVRAVVLESSGNISVIHGDKPVDDFVLKHVYEKTRKKN